MDAYFNLALHYNGTNNDSALYYHSLCLPISQKLNLKLIEAHILENQGFMLTTIGNYPKALESFLQSQKIAEDPESENYVWNLPEGQTPREARLLTLTYLYMTMGHLYGDTNNRDKQISSYLKSKEIAGSIQEGGAISTINMNLGRVYLNLNKLDTALFYAQTAIDSLAKGDIGKYTGYIYGLVGNIYQKKGNYNLALDAYKTALKLNTEQNNLNGLSNSCISLSSLYLALNKPDSSLFFAHKGLKTSKGIGDLQGITGAYNSLSSAYNKLNKTDSAYVYLKLASSLNDSLYNVDRKNLTSFQNLSFDEQMRLKELEEEKASYQNKIRTNTLMGSLFTLLVIAFFLFRNNRNKQKANKLLQEQKEEIQTTLEQLEATQSQLIQSEKMASLGELTAGIAHEIQNPLNFVNNFSEINSELIEELKEELALGNRQTVEEIANDIKENELKISHHGKRADAIVKGMLQHSSTSNGQKEPTDINALCDEYLRLSYHGLRAKDKSFNADFKTEFDESLPKINVIPQDIGRVLLNLINNAFYACAERSRSTVSEARSTKHEAGSIDYKPEVVVSTTSSKSPLGDLGVKGSQGVKITVKDNGAGIPQEIKDKIFQPFFTTKPTGSGTGLGLSLSYDIIKAHGGQLKVESINNEGSEFIIYLPTS
jgi:signal transduction histidine kinase